MDNITELSTRDMYNFLGKENVIIIDVRPADAYNGWTMADESRGGHIPGARSLPEKWQSYMDWIEIVRSKNIMPEKTLIIYGYDKKQSDEAARLFTMANYSKIHTYNHFLDEWVTNKKLPLEQLNRYKQLVPSTWMKQVIDGEIPQEMEGKRIVICHAHYRNRDAYLTGHIPGAIDIDTLSLESPETWNRRSPQELKKALEEHGITSDTTVVLYGKFMWPDNADEFPGSAAGHLGALRVAFIMMYAGVRDVRVLNGGFQSWKDAGFEIDMEDVPKQPVENFGSHIPARPELAVDIPQAKEMISSEDAELVCVRSYPEYIGEVSGYNYIHKKGRIPGAVFADCGSDAYHMENYRNLDHTTREFREIEDIWKKSNLIPDKHLAFYCGTGWRGSEAWFNAWLMGWPQVSVFDGGWFEWSNDPSNPYETGIP